jgi:pimeloyl-ACP methyl ester carboxylesterase
MPIARGHGGCRIHYETSGTPTAPPLLLLRGLARSGRFWLDDLRRALKPHFHLVIPDNRGIGRSHAPLPPYTTRVMAADAAAVLEHAGIRSAHVFGVSLGGMIAQRLAIDHPRRVDRLVLGCTAAGGRFGAPAPLDATLALARGATMPLAEAMRLTAPWVCSGPFLDRRPDVIDTWVRLATAEPARRRGLIGQALAGLLHDASRELDRIRVPTLVLTGDADRLIPARHSRVLAAAIPDARLHVFPGAGHDFPTEVPDETAAQLRAFFSATRDL